MGPASSRWGHHGTAFLVTSIAGVIALGLDPQPLSPRVAVLASILILAFVLITWSALRRHDRRLCELCATAMPLNVAEVAARHRLRFAVVHSATVKPVVLSYLAVLLGSDILLMRGSFPERVAWALVQSSMVYLVLAYSSHRRFQPWCPQCHGGQGERDRIHDAGPSPLDQRSR